MALTLIHSVVLFFYFYLRDEELLGLVDIFDFDIEGNVPTLYSAGALLFCAALLWIIARSNREKAAGWRMYWLGLAVMFLFLAIDEGVGLREYLSEIFEKFMEELFEMLAIVLFVYALLSHIVQETGRLSIIVGLPSSATSGLDTGPHDGR